MPDPINQTISTSSPADAIVLHPLSSQALACWRETAVDSHRRWAAQMGFAGEKGDCLLLPDAAGELVEILIGTGEGEEDEALHSPDPWLWATVADRLPPGRYALPAGMTAAAAEQAALGWALAQYRYDRYKADTSGKSAASSKTLVLKDTAAGLRATETAESISLVRDLVNTPAGDMGPDRLAAEAEALAEQYGARYRAVTGEALLDQGFPLIHTVGRAAEIAPRLIELDWGADDAPLICLVGKGVCFDSGGLNIKGGAGMRHMKKDMGGAAHVLGLARLIMGAELPVRLRVLVPAVENAIAGNAFRPGDILASRKGLSVEVTNTDAEGRLVLADAIAYAVELGPDLLVDFATLTGAARVALGGDIPALFTPDHTLADAIARASAQCGDPLWRLPLWQPYLEDLSSSVADIANASESGFAGSVTAALFLGRFAEPCHAWAHFDIYAWNQKARPGRPAGGEAMGLRAIFATIRERYEAAR